MSSVNLVTSAFILLIMNWDQTYIPYHHTTTSQWYGSPPPPPPGTVPPTLSPYVPPPVHYPWNPYYAYIPSSHAYPRSYPYYSYSHSPRVQNKSRKQPTNLTNDISTLNRIWTNVYDPSELRDRIQEFSLLCYNMLSQELLDMHGELYSHCDRVYSRWEYRKYYLLEQLIDSSADVICLQEMEESSYNSFFFPNLKENHYLSVYKKRTGHHSDGVAIFFKTDKFEYISCRQVEFNRRCPILDRDNVAIILKLRLINCTPSSDEDNFLYVATTHLLFNPKAGDIKLAQLCTLLAELREVTDKDRETHPVIICGDFNFLPNSCIYQFLRTGYLNYKYLSRNQVAGYNRGSDAFIPHPLFPPQIGINNACKKYEISDTASRQVPSMCDNSFILSHPYTFHSVYPHSIIEPSLVSTYHGHSFENVDYIFYSSPELESVGEKAYKVSRQIKLFSRYDMPTRANLKKFGPLPNKFHSSDHIQLISKFCYLVA